MRVAANGNVGIGTSSPDRKLTVQTATGDYGITHTDGLRTVGTWLGTAGGASGGWLGTLSDSSLHFFTNGGAAQMTLRNDGNVGIGVIDPGTKLDVRGIDSGTPSIILSVTNSNSESSLIARADRKVSIGALDGPKMTHVCALVPGPLSTCSSAAEFVPTVNVGLGAPLVGDLVSVAPLIANPFADEHAPFVVTKSAISCDSNLLGYITDPDSGADGVQLNDTYLPVAIFGYFPAKVTMEGGPIHRGDAITSSSTPGAGMKATGACRTIGYALEDADEDGTIQVFAHLSESSASVVTVLRTQVESLRHENAALKADLTEIRLQLAAIDERLNGATTPLVAAR
jgi:hypothetical protein